MGFWDVNRALSAGNALREKLVWYLVRLHLVLLIASCTVGENAGRVHSFKSFKQTLALVRGQASWNSIGWDHIEPNNGVSDFYATSVHGRTQSGSSTEGGLFDGIDRQLSELLRLLSEQL